MRYYRYDPDANRYAGVGVAVDETSDMLADKYLSTSRWLPGWKPIECHGFEVNPKREGDFPSLANYRKIAIVTENAWAVLRPEIGDYCEALPLRHRDGRTLYFMHICEIVDALIVEKSEVRRRLDGRIVQVYKYAFDSFKIGGRRLFRLPFECGSETIFDDHFRVLLERNKLRGLKFKPLPLAE